MVEFTCSVCEIKYKAEDGEVDERVCPRCFEYDDIMDTKDTGSLRDD